MVSVARATALAATVRAVAPEEFRVPVTSVVKVSPERETVPERFGMVIVLSVAVGSATVIYVSIASAVAPSNIKPLAPNFS